MPMENPKKPATDIADQNAVAFFESCGFERSVCAAMWIYDGADH